MSVDAMENQTPPADDNPKNGATSADAEEKTSMDVCDDDEVPEVQGIEQRRSPPPGSSEQQLNSPKQLPGGSPLKEGNEDAATSDNSKNEATSTVNAEDRTSMDVCDDGAPEMQRIERRSPPPASPSNQSDSPNPQSDGSSYKDDEGDATMDKRPAKRLRLDEEGGESAPSSTADEIAQIIKLEDIPDTVKPLERLTLREMAELEAALQIGDTSSYSEDDGWKSDWLGNLLLFEKEVVVNKSWLVDKPSAQPIRIPYCDWVASSAQESGYLRGLELLFRFVYHMRGCPPAGRRVLAHALQKPAVSPEERFEHIAAACARVGYDPAVLQQDGWTTTRADTPEQGETYHIGRRIMWQKHEAIVIAHTPDETFGSLFKAVFIEDLECFDLEPSELQEAMKKWQMKQRAKARRRQANPPRSSKPAPLGSTRFAATANFTVEGIESGIVLATPTSRAAQNVFWPARVRHVSENHDLPSGKSGGNKRTMSKNQVHVIFLAPFWNSQDSTKKSKSSGASDLYSMGPLFEFDTIDVSEYTISKYPFESLSTAQVESSFRFLGLPKGAFPRFLDAHRLAVAFRLYSRKHIPKDLTLSEENVHASAALMECHSLSIRAPIYPDVALNLPIDYVLSKLPHPSELSFTLTSTSMKDADEDDSEPTIDIHSILQSMTPPSCFGMAASQQAKDGSNLLASPIRQQQILSPGKIFTPSGNSLPRPPLAPEMAPEDDDSLWQTNKFASEYMCNFFQARTNALSVGGGSQVESILVSLISRLRHLSKEMPSKTHDERRNVLKGLLHQILMSKSFGEDQIECCDVPPAQSKATLVTEWRKACERLYKRACSKLSSTEEGHGNGTTAILTDSRCNGHISQNGSFERNVRLPAAIKATRLAGAGVSKNVPLITSVEDSYLDIAEKSVIPKAHKISYIKRLKAKCASISSDEFGVALTDDSDGEGGEDTTGSRGSYMAAVIGVAASLKAAEMVVGGQCVNSFCAIRPPGHHAGLELRSMNAISNGFCLFNAAACAAIFATTPRSQGGLGLRRVCVIDFDVHHGNGTQDILCSTYDPRFLYVSLHAGGSEVNGYDIDEDDALFLGGYCGGKKQDSIFPGRCGDFSPHEGVLNLPLGKQVTAKSMGSALVTQVTPRVESFSPDLIILSSGFDAHMNDPLGLGGLTAEDFGSVTDVCCQIAYKTCSGRIISVLEGGYGVPCCQPEDDKFLPAGIQPFRHMDLGPDMPQGMRDEIPATLRQKLDKCHKEGFIEAVAEHVKGFIRCNKRT